jgi:hypothetical protein
MLIQIDDLVREATPEEEALINAINGEHTED